MWQNIFSYFQPTTPLSLVSLNQNKFLSSSGTTWSRRSSKHLPWDSNKNYGGVGGHEYHGTEPGSKQTPIVFVHGNTRDAADWEDHMEYFLENGYSGDDLWAITFLNPTSSHESMAEQLDDFITHVRTETGRDKVAIVCHSLGVTGVRYWMSEFNRYEWVDTFVGIAGANHGLVVCTTACDLGLINGVCRPASFLRADYGNRSNHPLQELNENETPGEVDYYTIRGDRDLFFVGCMKSPELEGAHANVILQESHDGVKDCRETLDLLEKWL